MGGTDHRHPLIVLGDDPQLPFFSGSGSGLLLAKRRSRLGPLTRSLLQRIDRLLDAQDRVQRVSRDAEGLIAEGLIDLQPLVPFRRRSDTFPSGSCNRPSVGMHAKA